MEKPILLPELNNSKWKEGILLYDKESTEQGLVLSLKKIPVNENFEIVQDYIYNYTFFLITEHRLCKINNEFYEIVNFYYTGQEPGIIRKINEDEFYEECKLYNENENIIENLKISCHNSKTNEQHYFNVTIKYKENEKKQRCHISCRYD